MRRTFVGLPYFEKEWKRLGLTDDDRRALENELIVNPTKGVLIAGTNRRGANGTGRIGRERNPELPRNRREEER